MAGLGIKPQDWWMVDADESTELCSPPWSYLLSSSFLFPSEIDAYFFENHLQQNNLSKISQSNWSRKTCQSNSKFT